MAHLNAEVTQAEGINWQDCCSTHIADIKKCSMKYVPESDFEYAFVTMMNKLVFGHEFVLKPLLISLRGMNSDETLENMQVLDKKLEESTWNSEMYWLG